MKRLIVTGDDFGLALPVNEAIEEAHLKGILTTASLMVGAAAAEDAVSRAKRCPSLKVGLHLVLVEGRPIMRPQAVPDLVDRQGEFSSHLVRAGFKFFFGLAVRRQLALEIRAQFEAFQKTGLSLDHVNGHNHMHLHPTVLSLILKIGRDFGLKAIRVPYESPWLAWRTSRKGFAGKLASSLVLGPWLGLLRWRIRRANLRSNEFIFGLHESGAMRLEVVLRMLEQLPNGVTEMYFHPATRRCPEIDRTMPGYQHEAELEALMSPAVKDVLLSSQIQRIAFSDL
nr:hopanoid biosynthesis-associated protein HpnK [Nitrospirota bacterium]